MARSILDASEEEVNSLARALEQLQKNADRLTNSQKKLLAEFGRMSKTSAGLKEELSLLETYERLFKVRQAGQKDFNDLLKIQNDLRRTETALLRSEVEDIEKEYLLAQKSQKMLAATAAARQSDLDEAKRKHADIVKQMEEAHDLTKKDNKEAIKRYGKLVKELSAQTAILDVLENASEEAADEALSAQKSASHAKSRLSLKKQEATFDEKKSRAVDNIESGTKSLFKTFTGVTDQSDSFVGSLIQSHQLTGDWSAATEKIKNVYKATFNDLNVGLSLLTKIFESTVAFMLEFDKLAGSFRKNTGIIDRGFGGIEDRIVGVQRANLRMGVSMDEAFASANALTSGMAQFTSMTDEAQDRVVQTTALLQEFGVSAQTTSEIFNTFSKGLGYNAKELEKLGTQIMGIATSLKVPPQIIATEFNAASRELMKYGGDMIKVFEGLAEQSKQTGIAVGELMGIVKQYDTFEGAGAAVGKLNAILGGPYLNSINMLYATEEERVKMMRESIQLSGRQFKDLSRFEQQAIASAAGISDMSQAAKLFGGTSSEFANSRMEMKEMQKRAAAAQATQEKFTQVMQSFAIALGPVVTLLGLLADAALFLLNPVGEIARLFGADGQIISGLGTITVLLYGTAAAMKLVSKVSLSMGAALGKAFAPVLVAVGTFMLVKTLLDNLKGPVKVITALLIGLAGAAALVFAMTTGGFALPTLVAGAAGVAAIVASASAMLPQYSRGKNSGEKVPGGLGRLAEDGNREMLLRDGKAYMVDSPTTMDLKDSDTILNNSQTEAAMAGGGNLLPILTSLQSTLATLTNAISAANQPTSGQKDDKPVVIKMDERKVAETTVEFIRRHKLRLG